MLSGPLLQGMLVKAGLVRCRSTALPDCIAVLAAIDVGELIWGFGTTVCLIFSQNLNITLNRHLTVASVVTAAARADVPVTRNFRDSGEWYENFGLFGLASRV